jgi:hypothetical protein
MRSQSCHGRLLFKSFNIKIEYEWSAEDRHAWANGPSGLLFVTLKDNYSGTWGHKVVKTDFNKRELSCSNWMQKAKQDAVDGWAHKSFDVPVMRDFTADYPLPVKGASEGYVYFAGIKASTFAPDKGAPNQLPLVNYFALQKYPNQTTPNPDPEGEPIPVPPEPVPLLEKLRKRQPVLPILNSLLEGTYGYYAESFAPYYYLVTEPSDDPRFGYPPNWRTLYDEPLPDAPFLFLLTPNQPVFETRNEYQAWLADNLGTTKSQIFFPGAPNDPMLWTYGTLVDSDKSKADFISWRSDQDNAPDTLFATKQEWMDFFNARQQINNVPCGGISQCGASWNLVNDPEQVIECKSSAEYETVPDGPQPPPGPYEGTAKIKVPIGISITGFGPWRQYQAQPDGSLISISKRGNLIYGPWQPSDVTLPPTSNAIQWVEYSLSNLPFFNKNQNGCNAYRKSVQETGFPIKWYFRDLEVPIDLFEDIVGWPPALAGVGNQGSDWLQNVPATFTETDGSLTWEAQANHSDIGTNYTFTGSVKIKVTIEWTDL